MQLFSSTCFIYFCSSTIVLFIGSSTSTFILFPGAFEGTFDITCDHISHVISQVIPPVIEQVISLVISHVCQFSSICWINCGDGGTCDIRSVWASSICLWRCCAFFDDNYTCCWFFCLMRLFFAQVSFKYASKYFHNFC